MAAPCVLLVDDEYAVRRVLARYFERLGWTVREAADGPSALTLVATCRFDLVLSDINMPGMDGLELCEALAQCEPALPVIFMTGDADSITRLERVGAAHLHKPFTLDELQVRLAQVPAWRQQRS